VKDGRDGTDLPARVAAQMSARGHLVTGERVVVAVSGGLDSMVLLHLLRFGPWLPRLQLVAAHFDHRMRPESGEDALWVRGLALEWGVPVEVGGAEVPLTSEEAARGARYAFLEAVRVRTGARWILTAHHADDQAETVLFRIARGTGLAGLRGIPARRGVILRPLLSFWREELEAYVTAAGLTPRVDSTNEERRFARNVLRHDVLPQLEASVAPGARRALVRLARLAAREERAWRALVPELVEGAILERSVDRIVVARSVLLGYPSAVGARVLRALVSRLGSSLDGAGTRAAVEFTRSGASGRSHSLPRGLMLSREFDRLVLSRAIARGPNEILEIGTAGSGEGWFEVDGRRIAARWSLEVLSPELLSEHEAFAPARLAFPLRFRTWRPGDRIRLPYGSKKLKKLLSEARIPVSGRGQVPVLVDGAERVLWLPGIARASGTEPVPGEETFHIGIRDDGRA
jgi:tRNA(Ile)-lysidine synthase